MRILKSPYGNAAVTSMISLVYAAIFILTSGHPEFERILTHGTTLNSSFWNVWSIFLRQGNLKYIGYLYLAVAACMIVLSLIRRRAYDEYQVNIFIKSLIAAGMLLLVLFPVVLLLILSDPNYAVETVSLLIVVHWSIFLAVNLLYTVKWSRE